MKFYIIWSPNSTKVPTKRFKSFNLAQRIAQEMCIKYNEDFYIMEALGYYTNK